VTDPYAPPQYPTGHTCANCEQPIFYGEGVVSSHAGVAVYDGTQFVIAQTTEFEHYAIYHADCAAEHSHDKYSKDECASEEEDECAGGCGNSVEVKGRYCDRCLNLLRGVG
jgi:hypothetical protein